MSEKLSEQSWYHVSAADNKHYQPLPRALESGGMGRRRVTEKGEQRTRVKTENLQLHPTNSKEEFVTGAATHLHIWRAMQIKSKKKNRPRFSHMWAPQWAFKWNGHEAKEASALPLVKNKGEVLGKYLTLSWQMVSPQSELLLCKMMLGTQLQLLWSSKSHIFIPEAGGRQTFTHVGHFLSKHWNLFRRISNTEPNALGQILIFHRIKHKALKHKTYR